MIKPDDPGKRRGPGSRPKLVVSADGRGVVNHAGSRLLADLADVTGPGSLRSFEVGGSPVEHYM
jgi:hypothetical protein